MDSSSSSSDDPFPLLDLPPELIGGVSTYLNLWEDGLRGLIAVAGRNTARSIKYTFLKGNANYLHYVGSGDGRTARWRQDNFDANLARDMLLQWMEVNEGWASAHKPYGERTIPTLQSDILLEAIDSDEAEDALGNEILNGCGLLTFESMPNNLFCNNSGGALDEDHPFDVVIGVDDIDVTQMPFEDVKTLILKRGTEKKKLRTLHSVFWCFFLNPAISTDLGLLDVLRNLVEEVGIDVNHAGSRGIRFDNSTSLLIRALVHPDPSLFDYLLSRKGIDLNPDVNSSIFVPIFNGMYINLNRSKPLLHALRKDTITEALEGADLDVTRIRKLLEKGTVDANVHDRHDRTPLWHIVHHDTDEFSYSRVDLYLAKAFLDAGATKSDLEMESLPNRRGYRGKMAALIEAKDKATRDEIIASLRPLKRKRD